MACRKLVGRRWTSTSIPRFRLTLLTIIYTYARDSYSFECLFIVRVKYSLQLVDVHGIAAGQK